MWKKNEKIGGGGGGGVENPNQTFAKKKPIIQK
jgi:hypothetical protein